MIGQMIWHGLHMCLRLPAELNSHIMNTCKPQLEQYLTTPRTLKREKPREGLLQNPKLTSPNMNRSNQASQATTIPSAITQIGITKQAQFTVVQSRHRRVRCPDLPICLQQPNHMRDSARSGHREILSIILHSRACAESSRQRGLT
jgi:hypothetical protein